MTVLRYELIEKHNESYDHFLTEKKYIYRFSGFIDHLKSIQKFVPIVWSSGYELLIDKKLFKY